MLPKIWIIDMYALMIFIGVIACFFLYWKYKQKYKISDKYTFDNFFLACVSIAVGLGFAVLFQLIFDAIKGEVRGTAMTFYGGLFGGIGTFLLGYWLVIKKKYPNEKFTKNIVPIAPSCITIAHAFGRVGCFMAGCCYGKQTNSFIGLTFPGMNHPVYPTQLIEALFLFLLALLLFMLAMKKQSIFTLSIYLLSYGVFRFLIEFLRGDVRGELILSLSPSQFISIIAIISSIIIYFIFKKKYSNLDTTK